MTMYNIIQEVIPCTIIGFCNVDVLEVASTQNSTVAWELSQLNFKNKYSFYFHIYIEENNTALVLCMALF
jgi:hypothetical protein